MDEGLGTLVDEGWGRLVDEGPGAGRDWWTRDGGDGWTRDGGDWWTRDRGLGWANEELVAASRPSTTSARWAVLLWYHPLARETVSNPATLRIQDGYSPSIRRSVTIPNTIVGNLGRLTCPYSKTTREHQHGYLQNRLLISRKNTNEAVCKTSETEHNVVTETVWSNVYEKIDLTLFNRLLCLILDHNLADYIAAKNNTAVRYEPTQTPMVPSMVSSSPPSCSRATVSVSRTFCASCHTRLPYLLALH